MLRDSAKKFSLNFRGKAVPPGLGSNSLVGCKTRICSGQCNNFFIFTLFLYFLRNNKTKPLCQGQQDFTHRGCALLSASSLMNHLTAARDVTGGELCLFKLELAALRVSLPISSCSSAFPASHQVEHRSPSPLVALMQH